MSGLEPPTCSLRVSLFPTPNLAKNGRFAGTYDSALAVKYPPIPPNIASTADNCCHVVFWVRLIFTGWVAVESSSTLTQLLGVRSARLEPATFGATIRIDSNRNSASPSPKIDICRDFVDHKRFVAYRRIPPDIVPTPATTAAKRWVIGNVGFPLLGTRVGQENRRADSNRFPAHYE